MHTKIAKRLQEAPSFRSHVSRAPPLGEKFLDDAHTAREELLAEILGSAETDAGAESAEGQKSNDMTFGHMMAIPAESDWNITSDDFANEDLASLKVDLVASMHVLKLQRLTAKLGKTAWNDIFSMHVLDEAAIHALHSQIMAQELRSLSSKFVSSLRNNLFAIKLRTGRHGDRLHLLYLLLYALHIDALLQDENKSLTAIYGLTSRGACPVLKSGLPSFASQQAVRASAVEHRHVPSRLKGTH